MGHVEKTVFISYRSANKYLAKAVYDDLRAHNYDVFIDYEGIKTGDFEQVIIGNIKSRAHFVVILTPSALDRCDEPGDWLRREIETAMEYKRNIVPVTMEGFNFNDVNIKKRLTGKLELLKKYQYLEIPTNIIYFKYAMAELRDQRLNIALDTVLHPSTEVAQKAAIQQQLFADKAAPIEQDQLRAQEWFEKAFTFEEEGDLDKAIECYTEAIRLNPNFAEAYINRGSLYSFNDLKSAYSDYDSVIRFKPNHAEALYNRGLILQMKGDVESAAKDFQKSIKSNPEYGDVRASLMIVLRMLGRMDEADDQEILARELFKKEEEYEQACFEMLCGNSDKALDLLEIALDEGQATKEWGQQDAYFESIRDHPRFKKLISE